MITANNDFITVNEEYRKKYLSKGYFETLAKNAAGGILVVLSFVLLACGLLLALVVVSSFLDELQRNGSEPFPLSLIGLGVFTLTFLFGGIKFIQIGFQRIRMGADGWVKKTAEYSHYPENVIREFASQILQSDSIRFTLLGKKDLSSGAGYLTEDYIIFESMMKPFLIKRDDIKGAYLVNPEDSELTGNRANTAKINLAIFSNHQTYMMCKTKIKNGTSLIEMLLKGNPQMDADQNRVLSAQEYKEMVSNLLTHTERNQTK